VRKGKKSLVPAKKLGGGPCCITVGGKISKNIGGEKSSTGGRGRKDALSFSKQHHPCKRGKSSTVGVNRPKVCCGARQKRRKGQIPPNLKGPKGKSNNTPRGGRRVPFVGLFGKKGKKGKRKRFWGASKTGDWGHKGLGSFETKG